MAKTKEEAIYEKIRFDFDNLKWRIEDLPASELQTKICIMASALRDSVVNEIKRLHSLSVVMPEAVEKDMRHLCQLDNEARKTEVPFEEFLMKRVLQYLSNEQINADVLSEISRDRYMKKI